ncbi:MAG: hypothetical protein PGN13_03100 [Patulibacter minatonensis]
MSTILAAAEPAGAGGAPLWQLAVLTTFISLVAGGMASMAMAYRAGRAPRLRKLVGRVERLVGLPGWAAVPGFAALGCALLIITSATWDIGLHIDIGRDSGPLGTTAHYPLLFGLLGVFLMGILAIGLAPRERRLSSPVAFKLPGLGLIPAASVLLLAGSAFGMAAFPLDDIWHRFFGQDVTLWGPTHVMIIGGTISAGVGGALLLIEGALASGVNPFVGAAPGTRNRFARLFPALLAAIFLYFWAAVMDEFNWGVPQYREVWQPLLMAFGAAQTFVLARLLVGRGGTFAALAIWLPVQVGMSLVIGGPLQVTMPSMPLFVGEAVIIELIALTPLVRRPLAFPLAAGLGVGTLGFASEYAWTNVAMPLPWNAAIVPEGLPVAIVGALAGAFLGATMAQALRGELLPGRRSGAIAAASLAVFIALGVNAGITTRPDGLTATMALTNERMGPTPNHTEPQRVADLTVRINDPELTKDANWFYALGWQGDGRYLNHLVAQGDGTWKTTQPVPIDGKWKTMVRIHKGRTMMTAPIRFPADAASQFAGFPAMPTVTRDFMADTALLQIERKDDIPGWAWGVATYSVLSTNLLMVLLMGMVTFRLGRIRRTGTQVETPRGLLLDGAERVLGRIHPAR